MTRQRLDLLGELVARHLRLRYRRSVLGLVWSQAAPLATLVVIVVVFTRIVPVAIPDYTVFVLAGLLPWTWLAASLTDAAESVVEGRDLVRQPGFPRVLLPLSTVAAHGAHFMLALPLLLLATLVDTGRLPWTALALPVPVLTQVLLLVGPALVGAAVNVRWRDVRHLVGVALLPWFWATPVFYSAAQVPDGIAPWYRLNPMVGVVESYRAVLLGGRLPAPRELAWPLVVGAVGAVLGLSVFARRAVTFVEDL